MSKFDGLYEKILHNRQLKDSGKVTSIQPPFPRFAKKFSGFEQGKQWIITASSGVAKSKFTKFYCITSVHNFCKEHNIKYKVKYFALEESEDEFWYSFISTMLWEKFDKSISVPELKCLGELYIDDDTLEEVKECKEYVEELMGNVEVIDYVSNPYGIYKNVREYAKANGDFYFQGNKVTAEDLHDKYVAHNPDEYVFVITDHISLLTSDTDKETKNKLSHWDSIRKFSQEYCLKGFVKRYNYIVINVQQQDSQSEKKQFTNRGDSIEDKLLPSLSELADCKITAREADFVIGLFSPARYEIETFRGYNIKVLQNRYRCAIILKDRWYGCADNFIHLWFDGKANYFKELPKATDTEAMKRLYDYVRELDKNE